MLGKIAVNRMALNTWNADLLAEEWDHAEGDEWAQERVSEVFQKVVAEVKAEHGKALHLVKAMPRKVGK